MKVCPVCGSKTIDDAEICYGCNHKYDDVVKAVLFPIGEQAKVITLERDENGSYLKCLQQLVGGLIDVISFVDENPAYVVNDEGILEQAEPNRTVYATAEMERQGYLSQVTGQPVKAGDVYAILFGPVVAVSYDEDGEVRNMSAEEMHRSHRRIGRPLSGAIDAFVLLFSGSISGAIDVWPVGVEGR